MKIAAVGVTTSNIKNSIKFYELLGFKFPEITEDTQHIDSVDNENGVRLMIDTNELIESLIGEKPTHGNHSPFAIEYSSADDVDVNEIVEKVRSNGYVIVKEPWDAFWGQRYVVVSDPDRQMMDLFSDL